MEAEHLGVRRMKKHGFTQEMFCLELLLPMVTLHDANAQAGVVMGAQCGELRV